MNLRARTKTSGELALFAIVEAVVTVWDLRFNSCAVIFPRAVHKGSRKYPHHWPLFVITTLGQACEPVLQGLSVSYFSFRFHSKPISCFKLIRQTVYSLFTLDNLSFIQRRCLQLCYQIRVMLAMLVLCIPVICVFSPRGQRRDWETN